MAEVFVAVKPKYVTRKATDKVLFNEDKLVTIVPEKTTRKILPLFDTSYVALFVDGKYYPIDVDNFEEQYALVTADETPTVEEKSDFGVKKIEHYASVSESEICAHIQEDMEVYNGLVFGTLLKVVKFADLGDEKIDKNGFWMIMKFDLTSAQADGYSELKVNGEDVVNGDNYFFLGNNDEDIAKFILTFKGTLTDGEESGEVTQTFDLTLKNKVLNEKDAMPAITVDGKEVESLTAAFALLAGKGGKVVVNKSFTEEATTQIIIEDGKDYALELNNNAVVSLKNYFHLKYGTFSFTGNGTVQEVTPTYCVITLNNTAKSKFASVDVAEGVTLKGWFGTVIKANCVNTTFNCHGTMMSGNNGTDNGAAIYVNGNAGEVNVNFDGSTEGSKGFGMFLGGNTNANITGGVIEGSDGGIEIRAGNLNIKGARVTTTSTETPNMTPNGNGTSSVGCAIAISQHTTKKPINVVIDDVVATGPAAFMEGNPQNNPEATETTSIQINGGSFVGEIKTLKPEADCKKFLYGGVYSVEPAADYLADDMKVVAHGNAFEVVSNDEKQ